MKNEKLAYPHDQKGGVDPSETLLKMQKVLKDSAYEKGLSDALHHQKNTFDAIMTALIHEYEETDMSMDADFHGTIIYNWCELWKLINAREEEHDKLWNLALRGSPNP